MKRIFDIPLSDEEEVSEDTVHELGCGCAECAIHYPEED